MKPSSPMLLLSLLLVAGGCASVSPSPGALTPTELRSDPNLYDGKEVSVVAWVSLEVEDANLWSDLKDMRDLRGIHCLSLLNYEELWVERARLNRRRVEIVGTFRKDVDSSSGRVRFSACSKAAIEPRSVRVL